MSVKKYFLAIVIPAPLFTEIEQIKAGLFEQHQLKGALRSPAHITLHRPFEWKEEKEKKLIDTLADFRFNETFSIELKGFDFFEPRVVYVNVEENAPLFELHRRLMRFAAEQLGLLNEVDDRRGFHPHVTVAFRDLKKPKFYELKKELQDKKLEGAFHYTGFSLLKLNEKWEEHAIFKAEK